MLDGGLQVVRERPPFEQVFLVGREATLGKRRRAMRRAGISLVRRYDGSLGPLPNVEPEPTPLAPTPGSSAIAFAIGKQLSKPVNARVRFKYLIVRSLAEGRTKT